jgi:hypothetical protein
MKAPKGAFLLLYIAQLLPNKTLFLLCNPGSSAAKNIIAPHADGMVTAVAQWWCIISDPTL